MAKNQAVTKPSGSADIEDNLHAQLAERFRELTALTVLLREQEKAGERREETVAWLCQIAAVLFTQPGWWGIMPASWRSRQRRRLLREKGFFDAEAYLKQNPDVAGGELDPLLHYLIHGLAEGRPRSL